MYELTDRALPLELDTFTGSCTHLPLILNFLSAISKKKKTFASGNSKCNSSWYFIRHLCHLNAQFFQAQHLAVSVTCFFCFFFTFY